MLISVLQVLGSMQRRSLSVTVLSDSPVAEYKTPSYSNGSGAPFLRALKTSAYTGTLPCPLLEQPNIVTGLPAAGTEHHPNSCSWLGICLTFLLKEISPPDLFYLDYHDECCLKRIDILLTFIDSYNPRQLIMAVTKVH